MPDDDGRDDHSADPPSPEEPRSTPARDSGGLGPSIATRVDGLRTRLDETTPWGDAVTASVLVVTAIAVLTRLFALGWRVMHWDEVRVAYWILRWTRTGEFAYRPVIHGPFVQHVNHWTYAFLGTGDVVSRLPVALVGGLLPLAALLLRDRLEGRETVGLAFALALNPLLLYYSRFMRSDVLVAGFMFVALGFLVRLVDTRRPRHLYLATAFGALGFASKENAVIYAVCWLGMVAAVGGLELLYPRRFASRRRFIATLRTRTRAWFDWATTRDARPWAGHLVGSGLVFGLMTLFFYAPRGTADGLWTGPAAGTLDATVAAIVSGFERWGDPGVADCFTSHENVLYDQFGPNAPFAREGQLFDYVCNLGREVGFLVEGAPVVVVLAVIGVVAAWRRDDPGVLIPGAFMWGVASVLGYPAGTDILFPPWLAVHAVVALAIPAGVGLGLLGRWTWEGLADGDLVGAAVAGGLALLLVTAMAGDAAHHAYERPYGTDQSTSIVQYAQPGGELRPALDAMERTVRSNEGVDVLAYGTDVADMREGGTFAHPACVKWLSPLSAVSWTLYRTEATVTCIDEETNLSATLERTDPPIVISSVAQSGALEERLGEEYARGTYRMYRDDHPQRTIVIYVDTEQVRRD